MDHLLSASLIMASSHFPRDLLSHYQEQHVVRLDIEHPDFAESKQPQQHQHFVQPAAEYTSSPSLNSETDEDPTEGVFDIDVDYLPQNHLHNAQPQPQQQQQQQQLQQPQQPQLDFDPTQSPSWASLATPRAWVGEPHKLPTLAADARRPFGSYTAPDAGVANTALSSYSAFADYLDESAASAAAAAHSPPATYMGSPLGGIDYYPTASPGYRYNASLQQQQQPNPGCDPRFVSPAASIAGPSTSPHRQDIGISFADVYVDPTQVKSEPDMQLVYDEDSGEDEKSESDDPSYFMAERSVRSRSVASASAPRPTRTPAPEPVPNLTKKSRGRRVPTAAALYGATAAYAAGGKNARTYVCKVRDCGKCFARSEHLKRHVRSIHTNEKPHRCPHPGCNKEFSRHDNLCQHMRVHRNYSAPKDGAFAPY